MGEEYSYRDPLTIWRANGDLEDTVEMPVAAVIGGDDRLIDWFAEDALGRGVHVAPLAATDPWLSTRGSDPVAVADIQGPSRGSGSFGGWERVEPRSLRTLVTGTGLSAGKLVLSLLIVAFMVALVLVPSVWLVMKVHGERNARPAPAYYWGPKGTGDARGPGCPAKDPEHNGGRMFSNGRCWYG